MKAFTVSLLLLYTSVFTQNISVTGKIVDPTGKGISNCDVSHGAIKVTSASEGGFTITVNPLTGIRSHSGEHRINIYGNFLEFTLISQASVQIFLKDIHGKTIFEIPLSHSLAGVHRLNLSKYLSKGSVFSLQFLTISIDNFTQVFKVITSQGRSVAVTADLRNNKPLAKTSALPGDLKVHCPSSLPKYISLGNTNANLGNVIIKKANILLLYADDMNSWTGLTNNWAKTPNLDNFAKSAMYFERAHTIAQECNPSRIATLLGRRPSSTGMYWNSHKFREPSHSTDKTLSIQVTLPQFFRNSGYETFGFGKIFHQPQADNDPASWTEISTTMGTQVPALYRTNPWHHNEFGAPGKDGAYNDDAFIFGPMETADPKMTEELTGDYQNSVLAANHIKKVNTKPWFVAFGSFRPHAPLVAPKKYFDMYPLNEVQLPDTFPNDLGDVPKVGRDVALNWGQLSQPTVLKYGVWKEAGRLSI